MNGLFDDIKAKLAEKAVKYYDRAGPTVSVKTNLTPEITLFDSSKHSDPKTNKSKFLKYSVIVRNKNGEVLYQQGEYPETDKIKTTVIYTGLAIGAYIFIRGLGVIFKSKKG
jgi:hypothetical protein